MHTLPPLDNIPEKISETCFPKPTPLGCTRGARTQNEVEGGRQVQPDFIFYFFEEISKKRLCL